MRQTLDEKPLTMLKKRLTGTGGAGPCGARLPLFFSEASACHHRGSPGTLPLF
jgi:hypothetical protein